MSGPDVSKPGLPQLPALRPAAYTRLSAGLPPGDRDLLARPGAHELENALAKLDVLAQQGVHARAPARCSCCSTCSGRPRLRSAQAQGAGGGL